MADQRDVTVPDHLSGERLDKALAQMLGSSRSEARVLVDSGVLLDGAPGRPADRVSAGSVLTIPVGDLPAILSAEEVEFGVLYEDEHMVVVDKPAGVVVHPGPGRSKGTLAAGLLHRYPDIEGVGQPGRWGLVHRLDKDTSGLLLIARSQEAFDGLIREMRGRKITRIYTALAQGAVVSDTGTIEAPIGRDPMRPTRRAITHDGKHARTHYEVLARGDGPVSLLRVRLETGRTHQIRVHLAAIGHPVVGDLQYGARAGEPATRRIFLHATALSFRHPVTGEEKTVVSRLPDDLASVLSTVGVIPPSSGGDPIPSSR